jgi:hypothetical protein
MLKAELVIIGDNYFGIESLKSLKKKFKQIVYINASERPITLPNLITYKDILSEYIEKREDNSLTLYDYIKKSNLNYEKNISFSLDKKEIIELQGQPDIRDNNIVGVHSLDEQLLLQYKTLLYIPSSKNYFKNERLVNNKFISLLQILDNLEKYENICILTNKWEEIEISYLLSKIGKHITLIIPNILSQEIKGKANNKNLKIYTFEDLELINGLEVKINKKTKEYDCISFNYNSIVNHSYYNLNITNIKNIKAYGDTLQQGFYTTYFNLQEKYANSFFKKLYDESEYEVQFARLNNNILNYAKVDKLNEVIKIVEIKNDNLDCNLSINSSEEIIQASVKGEEKFVSFFYNRIRKNLKLQEVEEFLSKF